VGNKREEKLVAGREGDQPLVAVVARMDGLLRFREIGGGTEGSTGPQRVRKTGRKERRG